MMPDEMLNEMRAIKRLLIYGLQKSGATQDDIARALGIDQSAVSRLFGGKTKRKAKSARRT